MRLRLAVLDDLAQPGVLVRRADGRGRSLVAVLVLADILADVIVEQTDVGEQPVVLKAVEERGEERVDHPEPGVTRTANQLVELRG